MSFLFINKTLRLYNFKTRITVNAKFSLFFICVQSIIHFYYIICMTIPLKFPELWEIHPIERLFLYALLSKKENFMIQETLMKYWQFELKMCFSLPLTKIFYYERFNSSFIHLKSKTIFQELMLKGDYIDAKWGF